MTPKTIVKRRVVTKSISSDEGLRCVGIFRREDNSFGFEEYRKDPEANEGWFKIGFFEKVTEFASEDDAFDEACKLIPWLNKKCLA
tara:strand:- start:38 stop:295 length:258 start_codon:yes stop_codon:yes gene_type:complete